MNEKEALWKSSATSHENLATLTSHENLTISKWGIPVAHEITRDELKRKLDSREEFVLLETLPQEKYKQGHIPGAINLPPDQVRQLAPKLLPDKNAEIILYCGSFT